MSDEDRAELWVRWGRGESISEVARAISRPPGSVFTILKATGGYVALPESECSKRLMQVAAVE